MSPLAHAAYSREVKALPSSYHTGCTQTSQFNRTSDIRDNGDPEVRQRPFQLTSLPSFWSVRATACVTGFNQENHSVVAH